MAKDAGGKILQAKQWARLRLASVLFDAADSAGGGGHNLAGEMPCISILPHGHDDWCGGLLTGAKGRAHKHNHEQGFTAIRRLHMRLTCRTALLQAAIRNGRPCAQCGTARISQMLEEGGGLAIVVKT